MITQFASPIPSLGPPTFLGSRLRTVGFDVWSTAYPGHSVDLADLFHVVADSYFRLHAVHPERGVEDCENDGTIRLRFMVRDDETHATDAAIVETLSDLSQYLLWSRVNKLLEIDGIPTYVPLPKMERR